MVTYSVLGTLDNTSFQYGETSFTEGPIQQDQRHQICLIPYEQLSESLMDFYNINQLKSDFIINCHFIDKKATSYVMAVDRFHGFFKTWMEKEYAKKQNQNWNEWWKIIESDFKKFFGEIAKGLSFLFNSGYVHGKLFQGVVMTTNSARQNTTTIVGGGLVTKAEFVEEKHAKLLLIGAGKFTLKGATRDMHELFNLMKHVATQFGSWGCLNSALPMDLTFFMDCLSKCSPKFVQQCIWILDDPYFWDHRERNIFMKKMWEIIKNRKSLFRSDRGAMGGTQIALPAYFNTWTDLFNRASDPNLVEVGVEGDNARKMNEFKWRLKQVHEKLVQDSPHRSPSSSPRHSSSPSSSPRHSSSPSPSHSSSLLSTRRKHCLTECHSTASVIEVPTLYRHSLEHYREQHRYRNLTDEDLSELLNIILRFPCSEVKNFFTQLIFREPNYYNHEIFKKEVSYLLSSINL